MVTAFTAQDGDLLSNEQLYQITRHIKDFIPHTAEEAATNNFKSTVRSILRTACSTTQNSTARLTSWNALCALIDQLVSSNIRELKDVLWVHRLWLEAFNLYIEQAPFTKPKPARQLLTTLTNALEKGSSNDKDAVDEACSIAIRRQIELLTTASDSSLAKTGANVLSHFLSKGVLSIEQLEHSLDTNLPEFARPQGFSSIQSFLYTLFQWLNKGDFGSTMGHLIANVVDRSSKPSVYHGQSDTAPVWAEPLELAMSVGRVDIDDLRANLLPVLFKRSVTDYANFLSRLECQQLTDRGHQLPQSSQRELLFASLQAGKELGLLKEIDADRMVVKVDCVLLPLSTIKSLFRESSHSARLTALSILVRSPTMTKPFEEKALEYIKENLNQLLADTDANFRGEVSGFVQRLVDRLRAVSIVLARSIAKEHKMGLDKGFSTNRHTLHYHRRFCHWLISALFWELRSTAPYQRHISSLKCLFTLVRSGIDDSVDDCHLAKGVQSQVKWPFSQRIFSSHLRRILLDLLVDPFDDVRQLAANILAIGPVKDHQIFCSNILEMTIQRAEQIMLATGRADHSDGVAHLYSLLHHFDVGNKVSVGSVLLDRLEAMLAVAKEDLARAVQRYPIHGILTALRFVVTKDMALILDDRSFVDRIISSLHDVWTIVEPILCNDAPEGFLPEAVEEKALSSTRDTLSFCWRALKEASLLLGVVVSRTDHSKLVSDGSYHDRTLVLLELCFQQLAELRHRGAFSTVAQTWIECCSQARGVKIDGIPALDVWCDRVIVMLRNNSTINTRRSAGLPSLICGVLVAAKDESFFEKTFASLEGIARLTVDPGQAQEGSLSQVHAMNCLKEILKNTRLGETSERFVPRALQLAADALRSEAWAVRNCGLMLFRGVIDRLFGTSEAYLEEEILKQKTVTEEQCPGLLDIVLSLLSTPTTTPSTGSESVFPGLQILQRLRVPENKRIQTIDSVLHLTESPVWHVRDKAARTFTSFVDQQESAATLNYLLSGTIASQNALHGALLCARYIIAKILRPENEPTEYQAEFAQIILAGSDQLYYSNPCPLTQGAYVDLLNEFLIATANHATHDGTFPLQGFDFATNLHKLLRSGEELQNIAVPILALSRGLALSLLTMQSVPDVPDLPLLLVNLAEVDIDACVEFFRITNKTLETRDRTMPCNVDVLVDIGICLLSAEHVDTLLKAEVQQTMLCILQLPSTTITRLPDLLNQLSSTRLQLQRKGNQSHCDASLQIGAICVERSFIRTDIAHLDSNTALQDFVRDCASGMLEQGLYTREAVSQSLQHLHQTWHQEFTAHDRQEVFVAVCAIMYDLLNDDDETIRLRASETCSRILAGQNASHHLCKQPVPLVAGTELLTFLSERYRALPSFASIVLPRAFGPHALQSPQNRTTAKTLLASFLNQDTALFAEEKQNLYIDESREVRVWSLIAHDLSPEAVNVAATENLSDWTIEGLEALRDQASGEVDGAFGWSTNVDVFPLGLQIIYAAAWLLRVWQNDKSLAAKANTIRRLLDEFESAAAAADVNVFWRRELVGITGG